jgi:hypothetical protein
MASTYSTNLGVELIGTGEQSGTWGTTTNNNLGTLLEQAISGYVTQAVSTGADTTITIPNGASGVARNMYIELTGTAGASTNLIVPANKKLYLVFNNTASGAVTVKVAGQTGVSVPNAAKMFLVNNGTDVVSAVSYFAALSAGSLTLTTPLAIASGGTAGTTAATARAALSAAVLGANGDITSLTGLTTPLSVAQGGTGASSTTAYAAVVGNSAGTGFATVSPGTSGNLLTSNGTSWASTAASAVVSSFSAGTTGFTPSTATTGVVTLAGTLAVANGGTGVTSSTGTTNVVLSNSPTLVTPALGTPSALVGTNITGTATAFTASNVTTNANLTGMVTSVGNAASLGSFTSANLATALTDETGTGSAVFATSPTLVTPALGTPASGVVTNLTGTASININGTVGATTPTTGVFTSVSMPSLYTSGDSVVVLAQAGGSLFSLQTITATNAGVLIASTISAKSGTFGKSASGYDHSATDITLLSLGGVNESSGFKIISVPDQATAYEATLNIQQRTSIGYATCMSISSGGIYVYGSGSFSTTLDVNGITTLNGAIVGPGTATVFNTVSTTVNAFGAASTALNIGHTSGTNTVKGATNFSQTVTLIAPVLGTPASGDLSNCTTNTEAPGTNNTQLASTAFVLANTASQAEMETATSTTLATTPGRQQYHPSAAKGWGVITTPNTVTTSYPASGVSVVQNASNIYTITHGLTFSSANYVPMVIAFSGASFQLFSCISNVTATTFQVIFTAHTGGGDTPPSFYYVLFGDL